jgi:hypothetical protein
MAAFTTQTGDVFVKALHAAHLIAVSLKWDF